MRPSKSEILLFYAKYMENNWSVLNYNVVTVEYLLIIVNLPLCIQGPSSKFYEMGCIIYMMLQ